MSTENQNTCAPNVASGSEIASAVATLRQYIAWLTHDRDNDDAPEPECPEPDEHIRATALVCDALTAVTQTRAIAQTPDGEILDWLEEHALSVRIQANERQFFVIPATREAIRFEMTSGNVETSPNTADLPTLAERTANPSTAQK